MLSEIDMSTKKAEIGSQGTLSVWAILVSRTPGLHDYVVDGGSEPWVPNE
jgi:hypothetical protein